MKKLIVLAVIILFAVSAMPVFAESVFQSLSDSITGSARASSGTEAAATTAAASPAASGEFTATSVFQSSADTVREMGTEASSARSSSLRGNKEELLKRRQGDEGLNP